MTTPAKQDARTPDDSRDASQQLNTTCLPIRGPKPNSPHTPSELYELDVSRYQSLLQSLDHDRRTQYGLPIPVSPTLPPTIVAEFKKRDIVAKENRATAMESGTSTNSGADNLNQSEQELTEKGMRSRSESGLVVRVGKGWEDETTRVDMGEVQKTLRRPEGKQPPGVKWLKYRETTEAVSGQANPVKIGYVGGVEEDAIFPPGVPMSAVEILAFYPHHLRWPSVAMRLINNLHTGASLAGMISWLYGQNKYAKSVTLKMVKDTVRNSGRNFTGNTKWTENRHKPEPSTDLSPTALYPPTLIAERGLRVPTYAELATTRQLPNGIHARALTACIEFWLQHKGLELNVLHTAELYRALRPQLRSVGPMNLDAVAASQWNESGEADGTGKQLTENRREEYERGRGLVGERKDASLSFQVSEVFLAPLFVWQRVRVAGLRELVEQKETEERTRNETTGSYGGASQEGEEKSTDLVLRFRKRKGVEADEAKVKMPTAARSRKRTKR